MPQHKYVHIVCTEQSHSRNVCCKAIPNSWFWLRYSRQNCLMCGYRTFFAQLKWPQATNIFKNGIWKFRIFEQFIKFAIQAVQYRYTYSFVQTNFSSYSSLGHWRELLQSVLEHKQFGCKIKKKSILRPLKGQSH